MRSDFISGCDRLATRWPVRDRAVSAGRENLRLGQQVVGDVQGRAHDRIIKSWVRIMLLPGHSEEDQYPALDLKHFGCRHPADAVPKSGSTHRGDLVEHDAAQSRQTVGSVWLQGDSQQRNGGGGCSQRADRDGVSGVEAVILDDQDGARLAGIALDRRGGPEFPAPHRVSGSSSLNVDSASTKAWSSSAVLLLAASKDWRWASAANPGLRVSGTHTWRGRRPWLRSLARWSATRLPISRLATTQRYM